MVESKMAAKWRGRPSKLVGDTYPIEALVIENLEGLQQCRNWSVKKAWATLTTHGWVPTLDPDS